MRKILVLMGVGISVAILIGCASSVGIPTPELNAEDIPRISVRELWERLQVGEAILVVDARSLSEFEVEHIVDAVSIPSGEVAQRVVALPRDHLVVFY